MWMIDLWRFRRGADFDDDGMRGVEWDEWWLGRGCTVR